MVLYFGWLHLWYDRIGKSQGGAVCRWDEAGLKTQCKDKQELLSWYAFTHRTVYIMVVIDRSLVP